MADRKHYEILVIGSGEAGKYLAWTMAKACKRTAVIERKYIGRTLEITGSRGHEFRYAHRY